MALTQKMIIEQLKKGGNRTPNPNDAFLIEKEFSALNNSNNYSLKFKKTQEYWSEENWRVVAKDVQAAIKHYKSRD